MAQYLDLVALGTVADVVPLDRNLIAVDMLSTNERNWIDGYHARVRDTVGPQLDDADRAWLDKMTAPLT